jgi:hypothetical protein
MRLALFLIWSVALDAAALEATLHPLVVAYVPNWIDLGKFADSIPYDKVTHLNVAFENPENNDGDRSFNDDGEDRSVRRHDLVQRHPNDPREDATGAGSEAGWRHDLEPGQ